MKCDFHLSIWSMITSGENGNKTAFKFLGKSGSNSILEKLVQLTLDIMWDNKNSI